MNGKQKSTEKVTTKKTDAFCRAVEKPGAPIVIYNRPETYNKLSKTQIRESFASWAWTQRRYPVPGLVHTRPDAVSILNAELPPTAREYLLELKGIFDQLTGLGFLNSNIYVLQSSEAMLGRAGKERVSPVLMAHWTAAGTGAMTAEQKEIIPEGALGFFPVKANIPLHRYNNDSNSSVSIIIVPSIPKPQQ
ncbi:MAG: hypothetical protein DYH13_03460 [Alphaproteobacteria bacterium PRO2]|nr:hypothetical protein [Alphaproteobacteria bacterium PRO2]